MNKFIIDFTKYPNLLRVIEDHIQPWDILSSDIDWSHYQGTWKSANRRNPPAPFGHLTIETTAEDFLKKMFHLYTIITSYLEEYTEEWGITCVHEEELGLFEADYIKQFDASEKSLKWLDQDGEE